MNTDWQALVGTLEWEGVVCKGKKSIRCSGKSPLVPSSFARSNGSRTLFENKVRAGFKNLRITSRVVDSWCRHDQKDTSASLLRALKEAFHV